MKDPGLETDHTEYACLGDIKGYPYLADTENLCLAVNKEYLCLAAIKRNSNSADK